MQVCVVGLKEYNVEDVSIVKQLIESANQQRSVGSTAANSDSSRSHSIMQFALKSGADKLVGKLSFIDLAGRCNLVSVCGISQADDACMECDLKKVVLKMSG